MSAAQVVLLDAKRLRAIFNQALFWERVQSGELSLEIVRTGVPRAANRQPPGTRSITARLIDLRGGRRRRVALVHHYELPDGRINNRAQRPDPKWCIVEGVMYRLEAARIGGGVSEQGVYAETDHPPVAGLSRL